MVTVPIIIIGLAPGQTVRAGGRAGLLPGVIVCNFLQKKKDACEHVCSANLPCIKTYLK